EYRQSSQTSPLNFRVERRVVRVRRISTGFKIARGDQLISLEHVKFFVPFALPGKLNKFRSSVAKSRIVPPKQKAFFRLFFDHQRKPFDAKVGVYSKHTPMAF